MFIKVVGFPLVSTPRHEDMAQALAFAYGKLRGGKAKEKQSTTSSMHSGRTAPARHSVAFFERWGLQLRDWIEKPGRNRSAEFSCESLDAKVFHWNFRG